MDSPDSLVPEPQIDRTPYGACAYVGLVVFVLFLLAAIGLWRAAGWTKRHGLTLNFDHVTPSISTDSVTDAANQALQQAKQAAGEQVQQAANQAVKSAADAAQKQVEQEAAQAGDAMQSQLQNSLR